MLVVKVLVNSDPIDEIWVQRTRDQDRDLKGYSIIKPEGYSDVVIWHWYSEGYRPLLEKVLRLLGKEKRDG